MFGMLGKKVELIRYTVSWDEDERKMQECCISEEHIKGYMLKQAIPQ